MQPHSPWFDTVHRLFSKRQSLKASLVSSRPPFQNPTLAFVSASLYLVASSILNVLISKDSSEPSWPAWCIERSQQDGPALISMNTATFSATSVHKPESPYCSDPNCPYCKELRKMQEQEEVRTGKLVSVPEKNSAA